MNKTSVFDLILSQIYDMKLLPLRQRRVKIWTMCQEYSIVDLRLILILMLVVLLGESLVHNI